MGSGEFILFRRVQIAPFFLVSLLLSAQGLSKKRFATSI